MHPFDIGFIPYIKGESRAFFYFGPTILIKRTAIADKISRYTG